LVQSVDFFTPVVDDPFDFGRIAAANALSDIYAMGARPITALAVCAFPATVLPLQALQRTLAGGLEVLQADGVVPLGGHTVKGPEFTYGLAVTGTVHPQRILSNAGARPGDVLVLTKPLGTGVMATALKRGELDPQHEAVMVASMARSNRQAGQACIAAGCHALTDITGFGRVGLALELATASATGLEIDASAVPLLPGAVDAAQLAADFAGMAANRLWVSERARLDEVDSTTAHLLCDPQTSGGLLASLPPAAAGELLDDCRAQGLVAAVIGRVLEGPAGQARIRGSLPPDG